GGVIGIDAEFEGSIGVGFSIWVDCNDNMVFDPEELMFTLNPELAGSASGFFTVPTDTPLGTYRMRIAADFFVVEPFPCGSYAFGEAEDYTLTVVDPPSCIKPTDLQVTSLTADSVVLSWNEVNSATEWLVTYGPAGFDPSSGGTTV